MNIPSKQCMRILQKIKTNTEYLTHVLHISEKNMQNLVLKENQRVCGVSVCKSIVQITYLIYTCFIIKENLYVQENPSYFRVGSSGTIELKIKFFLERDAEIKNQIDQKEKEKYKFIELTKGICLTNQILLNYIKKIIFQAFDQINTTPSIQQEHKTLILLLSEDIKKKIFPAIQHEPAAKAIKYLQNTKLFCKHSDLLSFSKRSFFYDIKEKSETILEIGRIIRVLQEKRMTKINTINTRFFYQMLDNLFLYFTDKTHIYIEKSSTKDYKDSEGLCFGYIDKIQNGSKTEEKYYCKFYTIEKGIEKKQSHQYGEQLDKETSKNYYHLEYSCELNKITMRNITPLEVSSDRIDIISSHINNIMFHDQQISLETFQVIKITSNGHYSKKYVTFKAVYMLTSLQVPIIPILVMMEALCLANQLYSPLLTKKPQHYPYSEIQVIRRKVDHMMKLIIDRAYNFYRSL